MKCGVVPLSLFMIQWRRFLDAVFSGPIGSVKVCSLG